MTKVIAFIGLNGSGKSTAGNLMAQILSKHGYSVEVRPLARTLKDIAKRYCDISKNDNRFKLEEFAEEMKFHFGPHIFVKNAMQNVENLDFIIVPDLRFNEEFEYLSEKFGEVFVIKINRDIAAIQDDITRFNLIESLSEASIGPNRESLMTELYGLVSSIVSRKTC